MGDFVGAALEVNRRFIGLNALRCRRSWARCGTPPSSRSTCFRWVVPRASVREDGPRDRNREGDRVRTRVTDREDTPRDNEEYPLGSLTPPTNNTSNTFHYMIVEKGIYNSRRRYRVMQMYLPKDVLQAAVNYFGTGRWWP